MNDSVKECYEAILESIKYELEEMVTDKETHEVYLNDIVSENVDNIIAGNDRESNMQIIDDTGNEQYVDNGIIDNSNLDRMIMTMAYGCLEQEIYNDGLLQKISNELDMLTDMDEVNELLKDINNELECLIK